VSGGAGSGCGARPGVAGPPGADPRDAREGQGVARYRHEALGVVLQVRAGRLQVLLSSRRRSPYEGLWALPGGPLAPAETLAQSVARYLAEKVDVREITHLEQLETRSDPGRDPSQRVVATAYLGLVPWNVDPQVPADAGWYDARALPATAYDHGSIVGAAVERLQAKLSYTNIGFALAAPAFTVSQLRAAYRAALGHEVSATNLQRVLLRRGLLEPTGELAPSGRAGGRPATVYRFRSRRLEVTDPFAVLRPPGHASA